MAYYMQNHLSFEKKKDLAREYFFYPFQPSGPLCDASATGCGSFIQDFGLVAARTFSDAERVTHSTWRELENVHFTLKAFLPHLKGRTVKFFVDNKSAVSIIEKGSMKWDCHQFALEIFKVCFNNHIRLDMQWIAREENKAADHLSRVSDILDTDDWGLTESCFDLLQGKWGPFTVDCFANWHNFKISKFYSLFYVPGTSGVDAFSHDWSGELCLLVPPVALAGRALEHLFRCKARGVLVVPLWRSAFFWPLLQGFFQQFVVDLICLSGAKVLKHGLNKNSLLGSSDFHSEVLALLIDCSL
jgi:hypothetical protein